MQACSPMASICALVLTTHARQWCPCTPVVPVKCQCNVTGHPRPIKTNSEPPNERQGPRLTSRLAAFAVLQEFRRRGVETDIRPEVRRLQGGCTGVWRVWLKGRRGANMLASWNTGRTQRNPKSRASLFVPF